LRKGFVKRILRAREEFARIQWNTRKNQART
jgi:hypothetical protein